MTKWILGSTAGKGWKVMPSQSTRQICRIGHNNATSQTVWQKALALLFGHLLPGAKCAEKGEIMKDLTNSVRSSWLSQRGFRAGKARKELTASHFPLVPGKSKQRNTEIKQHSNRNFEEREKKELGGTTRDRGLSPLLTFSLVFIYWILIYFRYSEDKYT